MGAKTGKIGTLVGSTFFTTFENSLTLSNKNDCELTL